MARRKLFILIIIILLIISLGIDAFLLISNKKLNDNTTDVNKKYKLINLSQNIAIDSNIQSEPKILHFRNLKPLIDETLNNLPTNAKVGFYIQDANTGAWFGINESEKFIPASLLKIPIAMAILKKVERGEIQINQKIKIINEDINYLSTGEEKLKIGDEKTIAELLRLMIQSSDNTAKNALKRQLSEEEIAAVFYHVGINNPYKEGSDEAITPRQYTRLFKALYFSTFLSPESSEKLLDLATETRAESLIAAGIPWEIQVAHKYGERENLLHDCGIIYEPHNPYFLCIMTSGMNYDDAQKLIINLSSIIYNFISSQGE